MPPRFKRRNSWPARTDGILRSRMVPSKIQCDVCVHARIESWTGRRNKSERRYIEEDIRMSEAARQVPTSDTSSSKPKTFPARAYAASSATAPLGPLNISRRDPRPSDVQIEILFCGVCHSDLHTVRNEWKEMMPTVYPVVPGHEIVGRVVKVGSAVKKFKEGDIAAVGCLVDSCRTCANCRAGYQQYCQTG